MDDDESGDDEREMGWQVDEEMNRDKNGEADSINEVLIVDFCWLYCQCCYEHFYPPRMVGEIKEGKIGTANEQTVMWPNYLN